jgi:Uri superfamily endonuclease
MDNINHPPHYTKGKIEPIEVIEDWGLGYCDGAALKYIARYKHKGDPLSDLKKARWYIDRLIYIMEQKAQGIPTNPFLSGISYKFADGKYSVRDGGTTVLQDDKSKTFISDTNGFGLNTQMSFNFGEEESLP